MRKKLLVVDDHEGVRSATRRVFERDFEILEAGDESEALRLYEAAAPDVVLLDIDLHGMPQGWDILTRIRKLGRKTVVLLVTGLALADRHPLAGQADGVFGKPYDINLVRSFLAEKGML